MMQTDSTLEISALGRPLDLGTLYNARTDKLITGVSIWNTESFKSNTTFCPQSVNKVKVEVSESLTDKTNLLDVSASLKASILCGLVELGASATYLNEKTSSARQCRVTLRYHITTEYRELMISQLETPNLEVLNMEDATHVVTAVVYGADAFMEFQTTASDVTSKKKVQTEMYAMVNGIPSVNISAKGSVEMNDEDQKKVKNFSCKFYGDFLLKELPSNYEEAVKVFKELPSLLGENGEKAVPVKVWLYPLSKLSNTESKLKRMISDRLASPLEKAMNDFHQAEIRNNDLLEKSKEIKAEDVITKLEQFQSSLKAFTSEFLLKMSQLIPAIREGNVEEMALTDLLKSQDASGFSAEAMDQWLDGKETEISVVTQHIKTLKSEIKPTDSELQTFLMGPDVKDAFVFNFTSLLYEEPYLNLISQAAENLKSGSTISIPGKNQAEEVPWYRRPEAKEALNSSLSVFREIPHKNKVISFLPNPKFPGASVYWYHNSELKNPHVTNSLQSFACELTLDPDTAHTQLVLSEGNRKVTRVKAQQSYPNLPGRFDGWHQVQSREPLPDHCYWECQWTGTCANIGVAYKTMVRKDRYNGSGFGWNSKSWVMVFEGDHCTASHWDKKTKITSYASATNRAAVYLNRQQGTLSFYSVSPDKLTHLHTFNHKFTDEPLYAGFCLTRENSSVSLC